MRITGGLEEQNDKLVQMWACRQRSYISGKPAQCGHHYYRRNCKLLRWDLKNIIPLTLEEHNQIHAGKIKYKILNPCNAFYLSRMFNKDYKQYLVDKSMTDKEFVYMCNKKLKEALNAEDTENI